MRRFRDLLHLPCKIPTKHVGSVKTWEIDEFPCSDLKERDYSEEAFLVTNYEKITRDHLSRLYAQLPDGLESILHAEKRGERFYFRAFGEE